MYLPDGHLKNSLEQEAVSLLDMDPVKSVRILMKADFYQARHLMERTEHHLIYLRGPLMESLEELDKHQLIRLLRLFN